MATDDAVNPETAAAVALLKDGWRASTEYAALVEEAGSARQVLEQEHALLADEALESGAHAVAAWRRSGIELFTILDRGYPENLRGVHDRPLLLFLKGRLRPEDSRSVAVIGARDASANGLVVAEQTAIELAGAGYTVISGLARGIDTAAHEATLARGARTLAVVGNGLKRCYPAENAELQRQIANRAAVISQFLPDAPPQRRNFPQRNVVMSGLGLATVIIEAGERSGARMQARFALGHGRPVVLMRSVLAQSWAHELSRRPSVHVVQSPSEVPRLIDHLDSSNILPV